MRKSLLIVSFFICSSAAIFWGLEELLKPNDVHIESGLERKLKKDFIEMPDTFFSHALKKSRRITIQRNSKTNEAVLIETFFRKIETNENALLSLDLAIFEGETPSLIVLQFSLFDVDNNKIGEWAKSYSLQNKKKPQ